MKGKITTVIGNSRWGGYCFTPMRFGTRKAALEYARKMVQDGYWFAYRIK